MTGCFLFWSLSGVSFLNYLSHGHLRAEGRSTVRCGTKTHCEHQDGYGCLLYCPLTKAYLFTQLKMINIPEASCDPPSPSAPLEVSVASMLDRT